MESKGKYIAFLRGINVGGHHIVPMADLKAELKKIGLTNIVTLLNSGNVLFESDEKNPENNIASRLEKAFGFPIPTIIRKSALIIEMIKDNPFKNIAITKDIRLYVSFLKNEDYSDLTVPWKSEDNSYRIIEKSGKTIFSVLDLSLAKTPDAMKALEKDFGKEITTRNWNTILQIGNKAIIQQGI